MGERGFVTLMLSPLRRLLPVELIGNHYSGFNWVWKVILQLLRFCISTLCDWLQNHAPLSQPIRS